MSTLIFSAYFGVAVFTLTKKGSFAMLKTESKLPKPCSAAIANLKEHRLSATHILAIQSLIIAAQHSIIGSLTGVISQFTVPNRWMK